MTVHHLCDAVWWRLGVKSGLRTSRKDFSGSNAAMTATKEKLLIATLCSILLLASNNVQAQSWERTPDCEKIFLEFDRAKNSGFGAFALSKDGRCAWVNEYPDDKSARLAALDACEKKTGFVCRITHVKDDLWEKMLEQARRREEMLFGRR